MNRSLFGGPVDDEKPVTLDLSRSRPADRLAAEDISADTAREMQAAKLADLQKSLVWKVPAYFAGMGALWLAYGLERNRPGRIVSLAVAATAWFAGQLYQFHRLRTVDPRRRLIEDELRKDD